MMLILQQDSSGGGAAIPPASPPAVVPLAGTATPPVPVQPSASPEPAAPPPVTQAPAAAEPPISADTPMIFAGPDGQDRQKTVAELIDAQNKIDQLGDIERLTNMKAAMDGDPAAIQDLLKAALDKAQPAAVQPGRTADAQLDPETLQRLERLEQDAAHSRRFADDAEQAQRVQWIQGALASEGISKHVPLAAAHPDAPRRILESMNTAKLLLVSQGVDPRSSQGQQAMQHALFNSFNSVERQLVADQAHFAGAGTESQQTQAAQVPGQPAVQQPAGSVVPQAAAGAAPMLTPDQQPEGGLTKDLMRQQLKAQTTQMGAT